MSTRAKVIKAEERAAYWAGRLREGGYDVKITVEHEDPEYYESYPDEVMSDGKTYARLFASAPEWYRGSFGMS